MDRIYRSIALVTALELCACSDVKPSELPGRYVHESTEAMTLELQANGTYFLRVRGKVESTGTWTVSNGRLDIDSGHGFSSFPLSRTWQGRPCVLANADTGACYLKERSQ